MSPCIGGMTDLRTTIVNDMAASSFEQQNSVPENRCGTRMQCAGAFGDGSEASTVTAQTSPFIRLEKGEKVVCAAAALGVFGVFGIFGKLAVLQDSAARRCGSRRRNGDRAATHLNRHVVRVPAWLLACPIDRTTTVSW